MIWAEGISRYDVALSLRLLERKWKRVDSPLWIYDDPGIKALGTITPCFSTEEDFLELYTRGDAGFDIRLNTRDNWADSDEIEGSLVHEIVHAGQIERAGIERQPRSADWASAHADAEGDLGFDATVAYYALFRVEREAKEQEIRLVMGQMNRRYWSAILREGMRAY